MILHGIRSLFLQQPGIVLALPNQTVRRISVPAVFCDSPVQGFQPPFAVLVDEGQDTMLTLADPVFGMRAIRIAVDVYSYDEVAGRNATDVLRRFFDDYSGSAGLYTIEAVLWENEQYSYASAGEGRDTRFHVSTTNYYVQFKDP
jgi:hypothetical protein